MKRFIVTRDGVYGPGHTVAGDIAIEVGLRNAYKYWRHTTRTWLTGGHNVEGHLYGDQNSAGWFIDQPADGYEELPEFKVGDTLMLEKQISNTFTPYWVMGNFYPTGGLWRVLSVNALTGALEVAPVSIYPHIAKLGNLDPRQFRLWSTASAPESSKETMTAYEKAEAAAIASSVTNDLDLDELEDMIDEADEVLAGVRAQEDYDDDYDYDEDDEEDDYGEEEDEEEDEDEMSLDEQLRLAEQAERAVTPSKPKLKVSVTHGTITKKEPVKLTLNSWDLYGMDLSAAPSGPQFAADEHRVKPNFKPRKGRGLNFRTKKIF